MRIELVSKVKNNRQGGAIHNGYFFSFNRWGECTVYQTEKLRRAQVGEAEIFAEFVLDKNDILSPHSNAVVFGSEYYDEKDEFPLLYANVYNNYAKAEDKLLGVCLVYRVQRTGRTFETTLVQMIEIGFTEDKKLWKSEGEKEDDRPYGNFVVDTQNNRLYAFTMRDNTQTTRYFSFALPKVAQGEVCEKYGVKKVVLTKEDILEYFDCTYHQYIQGACCHNGKIYSLEGFTDHKQHPPAIRIIDTELKKEILFENFMDYGANIEPEMIDFDGDVCYYTNNHGDVYTLSF